MPSIADFMESLTQKQDKLVMMGTIKPSKDQALVARYSRVDMVLRKEVLSSLNMSKGPPIVLGDNSLTDSMGKGRIDLYHCNFNNVLYVIGVASNLLSVYQMTHIGSPKKVIFSPNEVEITEISQVVKSLQKELQIILRRYTCSHTSYPTQTPLLF